MKTCTSCGKRFDEGQNFCPYCGAEAPQESDDAAGSAAGLGAAAAGAGLGAAAFPPPTAPAASAAAPAVPPSTPPAPAPSAAAPNADMPEAPTADTPEAPTAAMPAAGAPSATAPTEPLPHANGAAPSQGTAMPTSPMQAATPDAGASHAPTHSGQGGVRLSKGALAGIIAGIVVLIVAIALIAFTLGGGFSSDEQPAQDTAPAVTEPEQPSSTPDNSADKTTAPEKSSSADDQADNSAASTAQPNSLEATVDAVKSGATGPTLRVDSSYPGRSSDVSQGDITTSTTLPTSQYGDYKGVNVIDGDPTTAWVEGADGSGAGSYIICNTGRQTVDSLLIMAGYAKSSDIYYKNARPAQVTIIGDGQVLGTATLADDRCGVWQKIYLDKSVAATNLCLRIDSVYEGSKYSDCAISEMYWDNHSK